jgi:hypothetical protein
VSAEGFGCFGNHAKSVDWISEISNNNFNLRSELCNSVASCVEAAFEGFVLVERARCEDDVCALGRKPLCECGADASTRARNDSTPSRKPTSHQSPFSATNPSMHSPM